MSACRRLRFIRPAHGWALSSAHEDVIVMMPSSELSANGPCVPCFCPWERHCVDDGENGVVASR